jgi:isocitrate lyase
MKSYIWELGKLGYVWQFITVSCRIDSSEFHDLHHSRSSEDCVRAFTSATSLRCPHSQKVGGADCIDNLLKTTGGISFTADMGADVTESQFGIKFGLYNSLGGRCITAPENIVVSQS